MTATLGDPAPSPADDVQPSGLASALAAFQAELPRIGKGNTADVRSDKGSYSYRYADLADVSAAAMPLLGRHGLAFTSRPTTDDDGRFALRYDLRHTSGESVGGWYPLPDPTHVKPQSVGSAITYARRYTLCAVTGIAPDSDDDDARQAQDEPPARGYGRPSGQRPDGQRQQRPRPADEQPDELTERDRARRAQQMLDQALAADNLDAATNLWRMTKRSAFADVDVSGLISDEVAARLGVEKDSELTIKAATAKAGAYIRAHDAAVLPADDGAPHTGAGENGVEADQDDDHEAAAAALREEYDDDQAAEDEAARADAAAEAQ